MTTLAQISDLHFGATTEGVVRVLGEDIRSQDPDVVVVSGDLTQRAKKAQFAAAARFLEDLELPILVVPGNHDVPLWNVARRLFRPYSRWHGTLASPLNFAEKRGPCLILGVNTVRSLKISEGYFSSRQTREVVAEMKRHEVRHGIVVTHHPLIDSATGRPSDVIKPRNLRALCDAGVDLYISGHDHKTRADLVDIAGRKVVHCAAGTATSTRQRGETNAYNMIEIRERDLAIRSRSLETSHFEERAETRFRRAEAGWVPVKDDEDLILDTK